MMKSVLSLIVISMLLAGCSRKPAPRDYLRTETKEEKDARMAWWRDARFGMFISWGLYAIPAGTWQGKQIPGVGEWIMHWSAIPIPEYEKLAGQFNPVKFNADEWVKIARDAGMKYIVITSKHHDGFCLWDSKVSDYDVIDRSPYQFDILRALADACERQSIRLCFYHSIMDWHHPDAQAPFFPKYNDRKASNPNFPRYIENYLKPQLRELLTGYGNIGVLWFDGEWVKDYTSEMGKDIYNYVRNLKPDIIINNRVDKGRMGRRGLTRKGDFAGDFGTPEQEIPDTGLPGVDWESCMTMNDTWGYKSYDNNWKSTETLIHNLIDIASKGGNFLLNVGPTAEGLIPAASVERLKAMGAWMKLNSEAIYGTTVSPFEKPDWGRFTAKPGKLYAHVFDWPQSGRLTLPALSGTVTGATLLADHSSLKFEQTNRGVAITLPTTAPDTIASVIAITYKQHQ